MAVILQQNVRGSVEAMTSLLETAVGERADLVLVQEPPAFAGVRHPGYDFLRAGRVMSMRRVDSDWTVTTEDSYTREAEGDVQVLAVGRRGHRGRVVRIVNAYFQKRGRGGTYRPAERALWDDILEEETCILAGDFNAHSPVWNPWCRSRRDAGFLEALIADHGLQVLNDGMATRPATDGRDLHSVIDLTLVSPGAGPSCGGWRVEEREEEETGSDHVMIRWEWRGLTMKVDPSWKARGWALKKKLDEERKEKAEGTKSGMWLADVWLGKTSTVPLGECNGEQGVDMGSRAVDSTVEGISQ